MRRAETTFKKIIFKDYKEERAAQGSKYLTAKRNKVSLRKAYIARPMTTVTGLCPPVATAIAYRLSVATVTALRLSAAGGPSHGCTLRRNWKKTVIWIRYLQTSGVAADVLLRGPSLTLSGGGHVKTQKS